MTKREKCCVYTGSNTPSINVSSCLTGDGTIGSPVSVNINPSGGLECGPSGLQIKGDGCCVVYSYESGLSPSGATAPALPASSPVENTVQVEVWNDCIKFWVYDGAAWQLDKEYCPNTDPSCGLASTTNTIDWEDELTHNRALTITTDTVLTFTATDECMYTLVITQGNASPNTVTWPGNVIWQGAPPQPAVGAGEVSVFRFFFDGTNFHGQQ